MISAFFDFIGSLGHAMFQVIGSLGRLLLNILSSLASVVMWPVRAASGLLFGTWDASGPWTPVYFLACAILLTALAVLVGRALWNNRRRK